MVDDDSNSFSADSGADDSDDGNSCAVAGACITSVVAASRASHPAASLLTAVVVDSL